MTGSLLKGGGAAHARFPKGHNERSTLGGVSVSACEGGDGDRDGWITVDEILAAVNNALRGCQCRAISVPSLSSTPE